ncbi:MAG: helix-turn-helix domain-containing protein [Clostridia bacterium]|nr:helix-turn-helix domain-containing protein [Clostridia bacterium]
MNGNELNENNRQVSGDLRTVIASNIATLRKDAGLTQLELAELINYSDKAVSKWERAEGIPDVTVLARLCEIFSVSLDYFIRSDHRAEKNAKVSALKKRDRSLITALSVALVWLVASFVFVVFGVVRASIGNAWLSFVFAVPVTCIVLLVFNSIWGRRGTNFLIISVLIWSFLISVFAVFAVTSYSPYLWLMFVLLVPAQIIVLLWSGLGKK